MFIVSVIVYSNCHILQVIFMLSVSALLLDDALEPATPDASDQMFSIVAFKTHTFHKVV